MRTGQRVTHVDYPKIEGTITAKIPRTNPQRYQVLWDRPRPAFFGGHVRVSMHIWSSLKTV